MTDLVVELYGHVIGHLRGNSPRDFDFAPERAAIDRFGLSSTVLSIAVPLEVAPNYKRRGRRRNYFEEMLPEGRILSRLANRIGVSEDDSLALLAQYGRDVAGALQIWDPTKPGEPRTPRITPLDDAGVKRLIDNAVEQPLGNMPGSGKTSLAGVQNKVVLAEVKGRWHQVHDGYPSSHIVKPQSIDYSTMIFDEEYGNRLASHLGFATDATIRTFKGAPALVIERYDRNPNMPEGRIHQEDMSQVLGARRDQKYQEHGGKVSAKAISDALRPHIDALDQRTLLAYLTFAVAIGNLDLHAKNISVLHMVDGTTRLAPTYDNVPLRHMQNDGRLALAVNKQYVHERVTKDDLVTEGQSWGLRDAERFVNDTLERTAEALATESPLRGSYEHLADDLGAFTRRLLDGKTAGPTRTKRRK